MSYSGALQEPARWTYDVDPATGNSRASYPGEVLIAGVPVGGPVTGTGAQVLQNGPTIVSPTITGTVAGGASYTSPTITGTVAGGATYTAPTLTNPQVNGVLTAGTGGALLWPIEWTANGGPLPAPSFSGAVGYNFSTGGAEVDFINLFPTSAVSFEFYQLTGAGAASLLASLFPNGTLQLLAGLLGTVAGGNAIAGNVGEYLSATRLVGTAVALTTSITTDILAMSLTAGDWDVNGSIVFQGAGGALQQNASCWITTASATLPALPNGGGESIWVGTQPAANQTMALPVGPMRINVAATTTVYLSCNAAYSPGTLVAYGFIGARRRR